MKKVLMSKNVIGINHGIYTILFFMYQYAYEPVICKQKNSLVTILDLSTSSFYETTRMFL